MNRIRLVIPFLLLAATAAQAHVVLEWRVANAGSPYKAVFQVGHGCGASPTRQVVVQVPAGVLGTRPMPKPGWDLAIERAALPQPVATRHGTRTEDVVRVTWTARTPADALPSDQYDEFVLAAQLPARAGPLWWPVSQVCASGRLDWTEVPAPGQDPAALKYPAARLELLPAGGGAGHAH